MNIGTAKPTVKQQKEIKHYLIDLKNPNEQLNCQEFQEIALTSIKSEIKQKFTPFLVGGSGLYMNSITKGFKTPGVGPQQLLRENFNKMGQERCWELLTLCDPETANKINFSDKVRTIRALEVFYVSGKPISSQQSKTPPPWDILELGIDRENLKERILFRTKKMFNDGLLDETKNLVSNYGRNLSLLNTIGYEQAKKVLYENLKFDEAIEITAHKTTNFAKRQRTWFRNKNNAVWLNNKNPLKDAIIKIESALR